MHELVHVFFPNGNRLLAEGLSIHLQARIGANPAFPNFGQPLDDMAVDVLRRMAPEFAGGEAAALDAVNLAALDRIATPSGLRLRATGSASSPHGSMAPRTSSTASRTAQAQSSNASSPRLRRR